MSFLGRREPEIYGKTTAAELDKMLLAHAKANKYQLDIFYTNIEQREIRSVLAPVAAGSVFGFGVHSYVLGLEAMLGLLRK